jgi:hypothetical protein
MSGLQITYADKDQNASIGTIERTWRAEDANEVKDVVNALSSVVLNIQAGENLFYEQALTGATVVTVTHDFGRYPVINVVNASGKRCVPGVTHTSTSACTLTFEPAFTGVVQFT